MFVSSWETRVLVILILPLRKPVSSSLKWGWWQLLKGSLEEATGSPPGSAAPVHSGAHSWWDSVLNCLTCGSKVPAHHFLLTGVACAGITLLPGALPSGSSTGRGHSWCHLAPAFLVSSTWAPASCEWQWVGDGIGAGTPQGGRYIPPWASVLWILLLRGDTSAWCPRGVCILPAPHFSLWAPRLFLTQCFWVWVFFFSCSLWTPGVSECPLPWCLGASPEPTLVFDHFCIVASASPPLMLLLRICCKIISFSCFFSPRNLIFHPFQGTPTSSAVSLGAHVWQWWS